MKTNIEKINEFLEDNFGACMVDEGDIERTQETIEQFIESAKNYNDFDDIIDWADHYDYRVLEVRRAQVNKGDKRRDIVVVDLGDERVVYSS